MSDRSDHYYKVTEAISKLLNLLSDDRRDITLIILYACGVGALSMVTPIALQALISTVAYTPLKQPLIILFLVALAATGLGAILHVVQLYVIETLQRRILVRIALQLGHTIPKVPHPVFRTTFGPHHMNKFLEVITVQKSTVELLLSLITVASQFVIVSILLPYYHPIFFALVISLLLLTVLLLLAFGRGGVHTSVKESNSKHSLLIWLETLASDPVLFKSFAAQSFVHTVTDGIALEYVEHRKKHFAVLVRQQIVSFTLYTIIGAVVLLVGGLLVIDGKLTLGQLVAAEVVIAMLLSSLLKLGVKLDTFYDLSASIIKLDTLLHLPEESTDGDDDPLPQTPLSLGTRDLALHSLAKKESRLNVQIKSGEKVALLGENGSGKSTFLNCIYRLDTPHEGEIEVGGINVKDVVADRLRERVFLMQGTEPFFGTIEDNLRVVKPDATLSEMRKALETVGLAEFIFSFPNGLSTTVGGSVNTLSRGQMCQLMIARAVLARPGLLLIDEILDNLDESVCEEMLKILLDEKAPWTLLVSTHSPGVAARLHRTIVIEQRAARSSNRSLEAA